MIHQICTYARPALAVLTEMVAMANPRLSSSGPGLDAGLPFPANGPVAVALRHRTRHPTAGSTTDTGVIYPRLQLSDYFQGVTPQLNPARGTDALTLYAQLLDRYRLYFTEDDGSVYGRHNGASWTIDDTSNPPVATLTAGTNHLIWEGQVSFQLLDQNQPPVQSV